MFKLAVAIFFLCFSPTSLPGQQSESPKQPSQVKVAIEKYEQRLSELQKTLDDAIDSFEEEKLTAHKQLIASYKAAVIKAHDQNNQQLANLLMAELGELGAAIPRPVKSLAKTRYYESVLGAYGLAIRGKRVEFINLKPPARDLLDDPIREVLETKYQIGSIDYIGTASVFVQRSGVYTVEILDSGTQLRINGVLFHKGELQLDAGRYDIEIYTNSWGQPYMQYCEATIKNAISGEPLVFVNSGRDIRRFTRDIQDDQRVRRINTWSSIDVDVSGDAARGKLRELKQEPALERLTLPESETNIEDLTVEKVEKR